MGPVVVGSARAHDDCRTKVPVMLIGPQRVRGDGSGSVELVRLDRDNLVGPTGPIIVGHSGKLDRQ